MSSKVGFEIIWDIFMLIRSVLYNNVVVVVVVGVCVCVCVWGGGGGGGGGRTRLMWVGPAMIFPF